MLKRQVISTLTNRYSQGHTNASPTLQEIQILGVLKIQALKGTATVLCSAQRLLEDLMTSGPPYNSIHFR